MAGFPPNLLKYWEYKESQIIPINTFEWNQPVKICGKMEKEPIPASIPFW